MKLDVLLADDHVVFLEAMKKLLEPLRAERARFFIQLSAMAAILLLANAVSAQTYTNLHDFGSAAQNTGSGLFTNVDGSNPYARLVLSGNVLYGTTSGNNTNGIGGLFRLNADGTGFSNFFAFNFTNGVNPFGALISSGSMLYGTTKNGGTNFTGSVFGVKTDGTGLTNLHGFKALVSKTNSDGAYPSVGLVMGGSMLYGTTYNGGAHGDGTVFRVNTDGTGFTNLFSFSGTNGANPYAALALAGNTLYGTTYLGGPGKNTNGTIFAINTDGTGFTNLHSFSPLGVPLTTNYDGANPQAGLLLVGDTLYGVAARGGTNGFGYGTLFSVNTDGNGFTSLFSFGFTNGATPYSELLLTNNVLYGTTTGGGKNSAGTVFQINTDGTGQTVLYDFPTVNYNGTAYTNRTGAEPWAGLVMANNALYGVTPTGGTGGGGTIYSLSLNGPTVPIPVSFQLSAGTVVLSWSSSAFSLQSTPRLGATFTNIPGAASPYPITPTNPQAFFRLKAN